MRRSSSLRLALATRSSTSASESSRSSLVDGTAAVTPTRTRDAARNAGALANPAMFACQVRAHTCRQCRRWPWRPRRPLLSTSARSPNRYLSRDIDDSGRGKRIRWVGPVGTGVERGHVRVRLGKKTGSIGMGKGLDAERRWMRLRLEKVSIETRRTMNRCDSDGWQGRGTRARDAMKKQVDGTKDAWWMPRRVSLSVRMQCA